MVLRGNHRALARAWVSSLQPVLPQHLARRLAGHSGCGCCGCPPPRRVGVSPQSYRPALLARSLSEQRARSCGSCSAQGWMGLPGSGLLRIPSPQASLRACPPLLEHPRGALSMRQPRTHATPTTGWPQPPWGLPSHSRWAGRGGRRRLQKQGQRRELRSSRRGRGPQMLAGEMGKALPELSASWRSLRPRGPQRGAAGGRPKPGPGARPQEDARRLRPQSWQSPGGEAAVAASVHPRPRPAQRRSPGSGMPPAPRGGRGPWHRAAGVPVTRWG